MKGILILMMVWSSGIILAQNQPKAYQLYKSDGTPADYKEMIREMHEADVTLIGEFHNNSIMHWMEYRVALDLFGQDSTLDIGMEMFEADDQLAIDEYMKGRFKYFYLKGAIKRWKNFKTDYKPIFDLAKKYPGKIGFYATNVPRRYAGIVSNGGYEALEGLSDQAKSYFAPLPMHFDTTAPNYQEMMEMDMGHSSNLNITKAQALKDATMAYFIVKNKRKGVPFVHYQGDFHSKNYGGIYVYLRLYSPMLKIVTLAPVESETMEFKDEYKTLGDYIMLIPEEMTKTY